MKLLVHIGALAGAVDNGAIKALDGEEPGLYSHPQLILAEIA